MRSYLFWFSVFACLAMMLYEVKYTVHHAQHVTHALEQELIKERQRLHMVELEWTRLSRPERVAALAAKHLKLQPIGTQRLVSKEAAMWHISQQEVAHDQ